jgi:hypothetical protein
VIDAVQDPGARSFEEELASLPECLLVTLAMNKNRHRARCTDGG